MHRIPAIILVISVQYFRVLSKYHHPPPYLYFPSPVAESHNSTIIPFLFANMPW